MAGQKSIVSGVAGRYATALFELRFGQRSGGAVKAGPDRLAALIEDNPELARLVRSPVFGADEQTKALTAVLASANIGGLAANFLRLVASNRRLFSIGPIIKSFRLLVARHKGEVTAEVTVAAKLDDKHLGALKSALKNVTGKDVDLDVKIDPSIIGGLIVKLGSRMVDTSLKTKLNAIKHAMKETG